MYVCARDVVALRVLLTAFPVAAERVLAAFVVDLLFSVNTLESFVADLSSTRVAVRLVLVPVVRRASVVPLFDTVRPVDATVDDDSRPLTLRATPPEPVVVRLP